MPDHDVHLRPARPDRDDAERFFHYLEVAADGLFRWMLGRRARAIVGDVFPIPGHALSYEYVWIPEQAGTDVGMVSGYSAAARKGFGQDPLASAAGASALRLWATSALAARLSGFMDRLDDDDWYLQAVAVDASERGHGIGSALLDHAESVARSAGARRIVLDVAVDNDGARALYRRRGMTVMARSPSILLVPNSAVYRMARVLPEENAGGATP